MTTEYPRGSEWRRCDLHIHTPFSKETSYGYKNDKETWDKFIGDIEKQYEEGSIIGICDYNTFDGYLKIKNDYPDFVKRYAVLPVIELRTDDYVGKTAEYKINLHIIFSNLIDNSELEGILNYPLTQGNKKIKDITNRNSEIVCIEKLRKFFIDNKEYYNNKFLFMLGRNEVNEIDNRIKGDYMKEVQFICSASETIEQAQTAQRNTEEYYDEYNIKYLHCSDAHSYSVKENELTRKIGHCYTWIKGIPSFETLRQAFFSYDSRIRIQLLKPVLAINTLEAVEINLHENTKIGDNDCCFAGKKYNLKLNPALNCFIGGRGTGKSLLLQLMCKKNQDQLPTDDKNIVSKIKEQNWTDAVVIDGIEFEYFGQGTIEKFYTDKIKFQELISSRLKKFWKTEKITLETIPPISKLFINAINEKKEPLQTKILELEQQINIVSSKIDNDKKIEDLKKDIATRTKIVEAYKDEYYNTLITDNESLIKKQNFLITSKKLFYDLTNKINTVFRNLKKINKEDEYNDIFYYAEKYNEILDELSKLVNIESSETKISCDIKEGELLTNLQTSEDKIKQYFLERGMSKANVDDLANAQQELIDFNSQLSDLEEKNTAEEKEFCDLKYEVESVKEEYHSIMTTILSKMQTVLKNKGNKEISNITFEYKEDKAQRFSDFAKFIKDKTGVYENDFKSILHKRTSLSDNELIFADVLIDICKNEAKELKSSEKIMKFFTDNPKHKKLYNLNCLLCMNNILKYEIFNALYQGKNLADLSFGQRATAIVITLLLFGNKPLIIDEPETHLDQRFIADDLVSIIKQVKNDKQIIFATHNANIVVNADAEQIFILKTQGDNKTEINQMTIEDVYDQHKKEELLLLEGSLEAFKKREEKYVI